MTFETRHPLSIWRLPVVEAETGHCGSTIYDRIKKGLWPRSVPLGPRAVGWPAGEVIAMNAARISGKSDDEIRELVRKIETDRKEMA
jgi:prophage regulatory protein